MKVFLSWSGKMSQSVACILHNWLPNVIQSIKPFLSSGDIDKGERWIDAVSEELHETAYGIICITPYNSKAPWLNFEAGALSKAINRAHVSPFLFGVAPSSLQGPLQQFQSTLYNKDDIFNLLSSINNNLGAESQLTSELLKREFEMWWPALKGELDKIKNSQDEQTETGQSWLYTLEDLLKRQLNITCNHIWMITPDIYQYAGHTRTKEVMQANLTRGAHYSFLIPLSTPVDSLNESIKHIFSFAPDQIIFKPIPDDKFHSLAVTDYVILNPDDDEHNPLYMFLELPVTARGYWIEVDPEAAQGFLARFRMLMAERDA